MRGKGTDDVFLLNPVQLRGRNCMVASIYVHSLFAAYAGSLSPYCRFWQASECLISFNYAIC